MTADADAERRYCERMAKLPPEIDWESRALKAEAELAEANTRLLQWQEQAAAHVETINATREERDALQQALHSKWDTLAAERDEARRELAEARKGGVGDGLSIALRHISLAIETAEFGEKHASAGESKHRYRLIADRLHGLNDAVMAEAERRGEECFPDAKAIDSLWRACGLLDVTLGVDPCPPGAEDAAMALTEAMEAMGLLTDEAIDRKPKPAGGGEWVDAATPPSDPKEPILVCTRNRHVMEGRWSSMLGKGGGYGIVTKRTNATVEYEHCADVIAWQKKPAPPAEGAAP